MNCRHCNAPLELQFADLGSAPPSNAYLTGEQLRAPERWYPLKVMCCSECWLVQTEDYAGADEIFTEDYAYFSSYSQTWLAHAERYVETMVDRFGLDARSMVVELAANDGYLLQFVASRKIPCVGVEPTASTAASARAKGINVIQDFFGVRLARDMASKGAGADLITANNVLAHVPDINDFLGGVATLLKENGVATFEFPHFINLVEHAQFDTIYHEHYSYLSLTAIDRIFSHNRLAVFDVEEIPTHGGSLRVYAQRQGAAREKTSRLQELFKRERDLGITTCAYYAGFQDRIATIKNELLQFLLTARKEHKTLAAYGAAAKGNTLLNYAGVRPDLIPYVVDRNPAKQNKFLPGSRIPIVAERELRSHRPDYVLILPWNLADEVRTQLDYVHEWGGRFVTAVPELRIA